MKPHALFCSIIFYAVPNAQKRISIAHVPTRVGLRGDPMVPAKSALPRLARSIDDWCQVRLGRGYGLCTAVLCGTMAWITSVAETSGRGVVFCPGCRIQCGWRLPPTYRGEGDRTRTSWVRDQTSRVSGVSLDSTNSPPLHPFVLTTRYSGTPF